MKINRSGILALLFVTLSFVLFSCKTWFEKEAAAKENNKEGNKQIVLSESEPKIPPVVKYAPQKSVSLKAEEQEIKEYLLKKGDRIEISVLDEPEMTREVFVLPDGSVNYLLVGRVPAEGKSVQQLVEDLQLRLEKYLKQPKVSVIVKELRSLSETTPGTVSVLGAVQRPGKIEIEEGDRLIDVITKAGGLLYINDIWGGRSVANLNASYVSRNGEKLDVSLDRLLRLADMDHNIVVQPGDLIYFAESDTSNIIVLGEVSQPNIIPFTREISLIEAISRCGGFTDNARKGQVIVLRNVGEQAQMKKIDIDAILNGREAASNLILQGGDIVFVPEQALSEYERYAQYLITFGDLILKGYQVREQIRFPRLHRRDSYFY